MLGHFYIGVVFCGYVFVGAFLPVHYSWEEQFFARATAVSQSIKIIGANKVSIFCQNSSLGALKHWEAYLRE